HIDVEIAFAAVGIGQAFALFAKEGARLGALGNGKSLISVESGNANLRAERRLRHGDGNIAVEVRAAPFEKRMLLYFDEGVQIPGGAAIRAGFAFAGNAQAHAAIDARGNRDFDGARTLDAPLTAALHATFANHLSGSAARGARPRYGEKSLLIVQLPVPLARPARLHASSRLRSRAFARFAIFQARNFDFRFNARSRVLEGELQVITQIRAPLRAGTSAAPSAARASAENILEAENVAEDVLKFLENRSHVAGVKYLAADSGVAVAIIRGALLRIGKDAIGFAGFAEFVLRVGFIFRIAIRMVFQRGFAIGALDLLAGGFARDFEYFVIISFGSRRHSVVSIPFRELVC